MLQLLSVLIILHLYFCFQIRVMASDNGTPARTAYEIVTLTLDRNEFTPQWITPNSNSNFRAATSVLETVGFNTNIFTFQATDQDIVRILVNVIQ